MCGVAAAIGIGSAILGIGSQYMAYQQAKADTQFYNDQRNLEWQAASLQAESNRATETVRKTMNKTFQDQTRDMADIAFHNTSTGITVNQQQLQLATAQKKQETTIESWKASGKIRSQGRIGLTVDSLLNDIAAQKGAADWLTSQNLAFSFSKTQQDRKVAGASRGRQIASAKDYIETTYLDPVKPLEKRAPGFGQYALGMASSALGGFSTYSQIEQLRLDKGLTAGGWSLTKPKVS
tara:strand:+ start:6812 stop:7522 length:711 start_codon:yes stop_codon:yes gene_type:complete